MTPPPPTGTKIELLQCSKQRCGHVHLKDERSGVPSKSWEGATTSVCPKCGGDSFYTLTAQGRCRTTKDRDLPREINAEDIEPSPRMGLKMKRRLLAVKRRALGISEQPCPSSPSISLPPPWADSSPASSPACSSSSSPCCAKK